MPTVISAVTFVAVPSRMFRDGGNFTYLQLGLIAGLVSRAFVAFVLVLTNVEQTFRAAVGTAVGLPKRQSEKSNAPKDELDSLLDALDDADL